MAEYKDNYYTADVEADPFAKYNEDDSGSLYPEVIAGLKTLYQEKIKPLEALYKFGDFHSPMLKDSDFDAKPMVLLLGQYSVGKTSFIEFMLDRPYPDQRIGPEPTTDRFVAIMHGENDRSIPGNALSVQKDKPFTALTKFGTSFLSKFEAAECNAPILERIMFIDTPGVLSGEKQRIGRAYDFPQVTEWFAERADLILLIFDAHKLDISDEFKSAMATLKGHDDKIRVVLNKADMVSPQQLMRVYGALMWSLGKVVNTPEVMRVYIGSFWDQPYRDDRNQALFDAERKDLLRDLRNLPRNNAVRKINELVKRARLAKVHAYIISHLKAEMPTMFYKEKKQKELLENLLDVFKAVMRQYRLPAGDFPDLERMRRDLADYDFNKFPKKNERLIESMDDVLASDIPKLMNRISPVNLKKEVDLNPFAEDDANAGWKITPSEKSRYDMIFNGLNPTNGKLSGGACKSTMVQSGLDTSTLKKLWSLSDIGKDGALDAEEFAIAMYLIEWCQNGNALPEALPADLVPPSRQ